MVQQKLWPDLVFLDLELWQEIKMWQILVVQLPPLELEQKLQPICLDNSLKKHFCQNKSYHLAQTQIAPFHQFKSTVKSLRIYGLKDYN